MVRVCACVRKAEQQFKIIRCFADLVELVDFDRESGDLGNRFIVSFRADAASHLKIPARRGGSIPTS